MTGTRSPRRTFGGSVIFAAVAALALPFDVLALSPWLGHASALSLHLLLTAIGYLLWLAPTRQHGLGAAAMGGVGILALWWLGPAQYPLATSWHALSCAFVLALVRSVHYFRARPMRALALELVLGLLGACLVALLAGSTLPSQAAALWGYLLVQSLYTLVPGARIRWSTDGARDPFERASARLRRLLDEV